MAKHPIILEEPSPDWPNPGTAMSEEDFHEIERIDPDRRYEYIAGKAYKIGGGTVGHSFITHNISIILRKYLSGSCESFGISVQVLLHNQKSGKKHYVFPDATVSCNPEDGYRYNTLIKSPRVVFEVIGPNTEARDHGIKFRAYQKCPTIQEIVLVNQFAQHVIVWQRDRENIEMWQYRYYGPGSIIEFASIDVHVEIEELYQDLNFAVDEDEDDDE